MPENVPVLIPTASTLHRQVKNPAAVKMTKLPLVVLLVSLLSLPFCVVSQSQAVRELATLLRVRRDWGDPPALRSWNSSSSPCGWQGINCSDTRTVRGIVLREMNITAGIPSAVCDLGDLTELDLAWNLIPGDFPKFLYNCSKLRVLDLSQNCFVGRIPDDIDRLPAGLNYLDLGGNNFTGDVPAAIGRVSQLRTLKLYQNEFDGTFPKEIGDLSSLEFLALAYNPNFLPQAIPEEFGRLKNMKFLWMTDCNIVGKIPESFNNLSSLEHLDLSLNAMTGRIPGELFTLRNLSIVYLYNNKLSGQIPSPVASMNLIEIDLSSNNLTGWVPEDFGKLERLAVLNLFQNQLSGEIPVGIGRIPLLNTFRVFSNNFGGVLPPDFGLNSLLEEFDVSENRFTGDLPENLCAKGALQGVVAFSNNLSGGIPRSLSHCSSLHTIQLYRNNFSGEFPEDFWALTNLSSLTISRNSFSGSIPSKLAENLSRVDIGDNQFAGELPDDFSSWSAVTVFLASNNLISGKIPTGLTGLSNVITLSLDGNLLSGELPLEIGSWQSLVSLNLSRNNLYGEIPAAIGSLPRLLDLDLSDNGFSGSIPPELSIPKFTLLNLSSNRLSGKIPSTFENAAYEMSFLSNSGLCSDSGVVIVHRCNGRKGVSQKMSLSSKYLVVILSLVAAVVVFAFLFAIFTLRAYRQKQLDRDFETWKIKSFEKVDFTEVNILYNLTDDNVIGSGGSGKVYRVAINGVNEHVAVKKISSGGYSDPKRVREFLAEVETLGTMRHRNIVKLICCISSENSKLLVYEYMENHSLDRWLHGTSAKGVLDWPKRLQVAIGASQGLCYMHHDCSPPIIHRDIKSSNILLDFDFNAKVADFGLSKILREPGVGAPVGVSTVAGSFGYFAPESAYAIKVNEKIDVYSFGVVLLELVTGREAHSGDNDTSLADWAWRHYADGKDISDAMDENTRKVCYFEEMSTVFKLGLACTSRSPATRPCMKDVLRILQKCCPKEGCVGENKVVNEFDVIPLLGNATYLSSYKPKTQFL